MAKIVPTITTDSTEFYGRYLEQLMNFTDRVHLDFSDGKFTPTRLLNLAEVHWPGRLRVDLHLMFQFPEPHLPMAISLEPNLIIVHAEAVMNLTDMIHKIQQMGVKAGVAILQETSVKRISKALSFADHALVFTGKLGYYGGALDGTQLEKIAEIKAIRSEVEVAVDGGVNEENAADVARAGADILCVGGAIAKSDKPEETFKRLTQLAGGFF